MRCIVVRKKHRGRRKGNWKFRIKKQQGYICCVCGRKFPNRELQIHHCKNRCEGGENTPENCCAVCVDCHRMIHERYGNDYFDPRVMILE